MLLKAGYFFRSTYIMEKSIFKTAAKFSDLVPLTFENLTSLIITGIDIVYINLRAI